MIRSGLKSSRIGFITFLTTESMPSSEVYGGNGILTVVPSLKGPPFSLDDAELLGYYRHRVQDEYVLIAQEKHHVDKWSKIDRGFFVFLI